MKNLLLIATFLMAGVAIAQPGKKEGKDDRQQLNPVQVASMKSKKLTLNLDLTDKQQKAVYDVVLKEASFRKEKPSREAMKEMSKDEKIALQSQRLDQQIAVKREMKNILNEEQYARWEKMMARMATKGKERREERRDDNRKRRR